MGGNNLRNLSEVVRDEMVMKEKILDFMKDGKKTLPQIAEHLKSELHEVIYWVMALRRYGVIEEVGKADGDGFFSYEVVEAKEEK